MEVNFNTSRKPTCGSKSKSLLADRNTNQTETIVSVRRSFLQASAVHAVVFCSGFWHFEMTTKIVT